VVLEEVLGILPRRVEEVLAERLEARDAGTQERRFADPHQVVVHGLAGLLVIGLGDDPLPLDFPPVVVNTMWALDDFTEANGATRIVPGSHRWVDRLPADGDEVVAAAMPAGSVNFYLGRLYHGGGANRTDLPRLGVILEYVASWLRPQENHILAVPADVVATLPERLQELLGYNIYPPFLGYVDGRHPRRSLPVLDQP